VDVPVDFIFWGVLGLAIVLIWRFVKNRQGNGEGDNGSYVVASSSDSTDSSSTESSSGDSGGGGGDGGGGGGDS
jgi:hypothetical protein